MTQLPFSTDELRVLADIACDSRLTEDDIAQLERLLCGNVEAQQFYLAHVCLDTWLRSQFARPAQEPVSSQPSPAIPLLSTNIQGTVGYFSSGWPVAYLLATVILGVGLLIGAFVQVSTPVQVVHKSIPLPSPLSPLSPSSAFVGRITGMVDCQWADPRTEAFNGANVPLGRKYALSSGLMEITYDTGAKVILQGPVTYEVESSAGGYLSVGKLTARVEKKVDSGEWAVDSAKPQAANPRSPIPNPSLSTTHSPLFTIKTPTAIVTDLGTEFGVEVGREGGTTSHVFRGSVRVQMLAADGSVHGAGSVLHENQAVTVQNNAAEPIAVLVPSDKQASFVREIPKRITKTFDLVDVVAGGDGFSGRRDRGIDASSGKASNTPPNGYTTGDGKYHRVQGMPFVDGVFIPDGRDGKVQLDSAGHTCASFGNVNNLTANLVWAGGDIPTNPPHAIPTALGGVNYASPGHGLLFLHANKGITFDLNAIRVANSGYKLARFRAVAGNTETISATGQPVYAELWVFVDGQMRFRRREINNFAGAIPVDIPIGDNDRFLTLAATDGGHPIEYDWTFFGDPQLVLMQTVSDATGPQANRSEQRNGNRQAEK